MSDVVVSPGFEKPEERLLLSLARPTVPVEDGPALRELLASHPRFDWAFFHDQAIRHRVTSIVARNIEIHGLPYPSAALRESFRANWIYNRQRNNALCEEADQILAGLHGAGIRPMVRKGQYLARALYPEPGLRPMSDLDLMVRENDIGAISSILRELGYAQGRVAPSLRTMQPLTRFDEIYWKMNASSQPPFVRLTSDQFVQAFVVDLRQGILEPASNRSVDVSEWFDRAVLVDPRLGMYAPGVEDFLIDICVHLHREATTLTAIEGRKDLWLLRFIDMLLLFGQEQLSPNSLAARTLHYGVAAEVGYALALFTQLYEHPGAAETLRALPAVSAEFLNQYGALDGEPAQWSADFRTRLFDNYRFLEPTATAKLVP
ncbi:nucleotidyltransferase family protein [Micromonospora sp. NPDC002296]|uniref:nucleotidyltransferase family protein n=1 Tax=Micromonospora sp. NPDC002296 TaxID=3154271 RepID=UPI0033295B3C